MKKILRIFLLAVGLATMAGCMGVESRIKRNPEVFAQCTPEQQSLIRAGKVGVGFTHDMAKLALGEPDRVSVRTVVGSRSHVTYLRETWRYMTYQADPLAIQSAFVDMGYYGVRAMDAHYTYMGTPSYTTRTRAVVVMLFHDGRVAAVDQKK